MTDQALELLAETVQYNCHVSDARHGADDSLCVYLMKMREYYRWEKRLPYGAALERDQVGDWLANRERLWEALEGAELKPIALGGETFDPFDADAINARLAGHGLVYSGGLGRRAKPHFVLGDLECRERSEDGALYVVADEYARDLTAPPAMTQGRTIYLRRESLRRLLWERLEGWRWTRPDNALGRAFGCYDFEGALDDSLDAMTDREMRTLLLHEQGEVAAGLRLGDGWERMLLDLSQTPAELMARAVRDHLADCLVTLPALAEGADPASLHFFLGNLTGMRKEIFPRLLDAYRAWMGQGDEGGVGMGPAGRDASGFAVLAEQGRDHWEGLALALLDLYRSLGAESASPIRALVESSRL
jgi:hypothetical protein